MNRREGDDLDRDLREEIESHIRMRAEHDRITETDARRRFGNAMQIQEEMRTMHIPTYLDELAQDLRYALRRAVRMPGFTFAVVAAIAIGIGASTSVFSVVDRILFRPLPYANEHELVWLGMTAPIFGSDEFLTAGDYFDWKERQTVFTRFTAARGSMDCDATEVNPERFHCFLADHDFLATFGMAPALGRSFERNDKDQILISHALWQQRYGGSQDVIGKTISLDGQRWRVAGVLPANFEVPSLAPVDILKPIDVDEAIERSSKGRMTFLRTWARLKPGVSVEQARQALQPQMQYSLQFVPPAFVKEVKLQVSQLRDRQTMQSRQVSLTLLGACLCVLLISCANVMNLLLARANASERETAIREAIGASRGRLVRQNLTESILLAGFGGTLGIAIAWALVRIAVTLAPSVIPRMQEASLDGRVLAFALILTFACGLNSGAAVAWRRTHGLDPLSGHRVTSSRSRYLRPALVVLQIALAAALLHSAAILGDNFLRMQQEPLGFQADNLLSTTIQLRDATYAQPQARQAFWRTLEERLRTLPLPGPVALSDSLPPTGRAMTRILSRIRLDGKPEDLGKGTGGMVICRTVSPEYFQALGIRTLNGRVFTNQDRAENTQPPVVLSERLAGKLFGSASQAVGHLLQPGPDSPWSPIVGVVADVRNNGLETGDPEFYLPLSSSPANGGITVLVRTNVNPKPVQELVRAAILSVDSHLPFTFETMEQRTAKLTAGAKFNTTVLGLFSLAGLLLGATGIYSVVSFLVSQRTREIGVRVALGATSQNIRKMILSYAVRWTAAGCLAACALIVSVTPHLQELLYQPSTQANPKAAALVLMVMALIAIGSALVPAMRAARLDPIQTLRED
jgi:predicted permease